MGDSPNERPREREEREGGREEGREKGKEGESVQGMPMVHPDHRGSSRAERKQATKPGRGREEIYMRITK